MGRKEEKLTISGLLEVDVRVSERATSDRVTAHSDGQHGTGRGELVEEHRLSHIRMEITDVPA